MKRQKVILSAFALALIGGTALLLGAVPQKLGAPGVKASPVPGSERWQVYLPERVLDFASTNLQADSNSLAMLPKDTSIADRVYYKPGIIPFNSGVVLMGTDRTSIHKAEYCLQGAGMHIDEAAKDTVRVEQPQSYDLPIIKIVASENVPVNGKVITKKCVYVYWYVADGALSNDRSGMERMWAMAKQLVLTGVLQRWAYVRFYAFCDPGQEDAVYAEIKRMIADSVPQFQLTHGPSTTTVAAQR
jgi:hypothetical protein